MKKCGECLKRKKAENFHKNAASRDGLNSWCIACKRAWNIKNSDRRALYVRRSSKKVRLAIIDKFGAKCIKCGFDNPKALQLDHIGGGGTTERRVVGGNQKMFRMILAGKLNARRYQILCANCNAIKRIENYDEAGRKYNVQV